MARMESRGAHQTWRPATLYRLLLLRRRVVGGRVPDPRRTSAAEESHSHKGSSGPGQNPGHVAAPRADGSPHRGQQLRPASLGGALDQARPGGVIMHHHTRPDPPMPTESFPTDPTGLPEAGRPELLELAPGDTFDLRVGPVAKRLGDTTVRMLGYNGSIPGPTLKVRQGSEVIVHVENQGDLDATVHWHGLCLENKYDGVPNETQPPIPVGGEFTYRIQFPDAGLYWYHPHIREDYTQELGLYGNILVVPSEPDYWPPADQDFILTVDDLLVEGGRSAQFSPSSEERRV